ncbi:MAG: phosphoribosyl-AMP cyclohydrolase [Candidatus Ratteibacteria bacterium]|nr:phosphoribosyl-AMP cyclohydrolase [Candidatus Ratteibacteria bacterium]
MDVDKLNFKNDGLIPAIIQDCENLQVLMVGYMNKEALRLTLETGTVHFYSRSRKKLWKKGETSGHVQKVKEILVDCDEDTLLIKVQQKTASCHEGYRSCFFRKLDDRGNLKIVEKKVFEPEDIYKK